ncbi:hypothetical protein Emin_0982 [Elusimicrobium minutum Pei191]|uniref:Uncharacterized protein n=1 Tax=Elusimicrobium minutum (strain Pei191) TaxID=445932 RepID=B2KDD9_ELUMP|nr:hypothetical protein [Elusimicrobium minutum]ACC98535.1 hypothetical protein Emin_0982 [Elusimicrobium minutum Pei191]
MAKKLNSFKDTAGKLWVACCECEAGGNGSAEGKCGGGSTAKKFNGMGCFAGTLLNNLQGVL